MPQMTLFAPDITCDHCIATIRQAVGTVEGARFVSGDPDARSFIVDIERGAVLDQVAETLAAEGYPLGDPSAVSPVVSSTMIPLGMMHVAPSAAQAATFVPTYRAERSDAGADVVYSCPCGSTTEVFHYDRSKAEQEPHSCCNHKVLVAPGAADRLRAIAPGFEVISVQTVEMPWGQPLEAAMAVAK
jgi:copper chaperone CopZ